MGNGANTLRAVVGLKPKISVEEQLRNACFFGQKDLVDELLLTVPRGPGGPVDSEDPIGYTPIMYAAGSGFPEILDALLQHGATLNHRAQNGLTALHKAAEGGKIKCLNVLLQWRAEINSQSSLGYTAAMCACLEKKDNFLKVLIANKADLTLRDNKGNTCLDLATHAGTIEILEEGMRERSDVEAKRRAQLAEKKAFLEAKIKEARFREEQAKKKKRADEEEAQRQATERNLREMAEKARRDNEEFEAAMRAQQERERAEAEERTRREQECERARDELCRKKRLSLGTLAAFIALDNQYVLSKLLDASRKVTKGGGGSGSGGIDDDADLEAHEYFINLVHSLTQRKKELTEQLVLLNLTPVTPTEYLSVGRWGGVLGQVDWVMARVLEEWDAQEEPLPLARRAPVEDSAAYQELLAIKLYFKENDSAAGRLRQQQELEAQRAAREAAIRDEEAREAAAAAARAEEQRLQQQRAESEEKERTVAYLRSVLCRELGLPLPLAAAHLVLCNSATLAIIVALNKAVAASGEGEAAAVAGSGAELVDEIKALAVDKKALSQQIVALGLGVLVPTDMPPGVGVAGLGISSDNNSAALVAQIDWLAAKVRELQVQASERGIEEEKTPQQQQPLPAHESSEPLQATIDQASAALLQHVARLQEELGKHMASLHSPGSAAWRRDRVLASLASLRTKLLGDGKEQQLAQAQILLTKLEDMKKALAAASSSRSATDEQKREEQEKAAFFAAKAQRLVEEQEEAAREAARAQEVARLEELARSKEEERRRRQEALEALRQPEPVRRGGERRGKAGVDDLDSAARFRDSKLGLVSGGGVLPR